MANDFSSVPESALAKLGHRLYKRALIRRDQEPITDPRGQPIGWLLDTRIPMLEADMFSEIGEVISERLRGRSVFQVVGAGYGAFPIVCSVLGTPNLPGEQQFRGGFVRERRKPYGRRRLVEGPLDRQESVVLVDDILNSGRSAARAVSMLQTDGFHVAGVLTLFNFTWSGGKKRLESEGLWVESILELNLRDNNAIGEVSSSDGRR